MKRMHPLPVSSVEQPRAATSSFWFWLFLLALGAGGYWFYTDQQAKNQAHRDALAERVEENRAIQEENARRKQQMKQAPTSHAGSGLGVDDLSELADAGESDAELAEREALERENILAAEELLRLRKEQDMQDMLHPYGTEDEASQPEKKKKELNRVPGALTQYPVFNARVNTKAEYYIYWCSASWCDFCRKLVPEVLEQYKKIRRFSKVELILISYDRSLFDAKAYPKNLKMKCPTIWIEDMRSRALQRLPGFDDRTFVPYAYIVDKDGRLLARGNASIINQWQSYISKDEKSK